MHDDLCVCIVTYGKRWHLLREAVSSTVLLNPKMIIILSNNGQIDFESLECLYDKNKILLEHSNINSGSAGGFNRAIEKFLLETECEWCLLLDDDNIIPEDSAIELANRLNHLDTERIYMLNRQDKLWIREILNGEGVSSVFPDKDSFLGFNIVSRLLKNTSEKFDKIPYLPYSGSIISRKCINAAGLPKTDFFLYVDDTEFTHRIIRCGFDVNIMKEILLVDIDKSWHYSNQSASTIIAKTDQDYRIFYQFRNQVYFERNYVVRSRLIHNLNVTLFSLFVLLKCLFFSNKSVALAVLRGLYSGYRENLGVDKRYAR